MDNEKQPDDTSEQVEELPSAEVSYEALEDEIERMRRNKGPGDLVDTRHTDGSTHSPVLALDQGLVYIPLSDPPVLPGDDRQNANMATGFASSMEENDPGIGELPAHVAGNDLDLEQRIRTMSPNNSETAHLPDVNLYVHDGIVILAGWVETSSDIAIVDEMLRDMRGVHDVRNRLESG